jgi:tetratricopeptide (TPR) repeat protein
VTSLDSARAALERGDFQEALDNLGGLHAPVTDPEALELRAAAAYGVGEFEAAVSAWESLYSLHAAAGRDEDASWAAARVALNLLVESGMLAPVRGWVRRAERLVEGQPVGRVHALLAIVRTYERFLSGDPEAAHEHAQQAVELGTTFGVDPARGLGQIALARLLINEGGLERGVAMLDEVAFSLMAGEFDPLTTGNMYCELICAAQWVHLLDRAREWTEVMERWRQGPAYGPIHGRCRVHRAELLRSSGPADRAEEEALGACTDLRPWMRREFGWPLVELGNIRLRRGNLLGAEEAFLSAHEHAWSPHPGLALLRMAQGDIDTAVALIADAIEHPTEVPWKERPPFGNLWRTPLLEAQAEIAAAAGDLETTRLAAQALRSIADAYPTPSLAAGAALAEGRAALLAGETREAISACTVAVSHWVELGAPYEAASARLVLGEAHARAGNQSRADQEWLAAGAGFTAFGAETWARHAVALVSGTPPTAGKSTAVFRVAGDNRLICFRGIEVSMVDLKGFRYLERMLAAPGREFHALDVVAVEQGAVPDPAGAATGMEHGLGIDDGAGLPVIDDQARAAYRRRLLDIDEDIADAVAMNDPGRQALAERDREFLVAELSSALGLAGRQRLSDGNAERARTSVTRSLRYALGRLSEHHPDLGGHLDRTVRTGIYCSYQPDPLTPIAWVLSG